MAYEIVWRGRARDRFKEIVEYLQGDWSPKVAIEFIIIVEEKLSLLKSFPFIGIRSTKKQELRKLVLTKHNILVYTIKKGRIILLQIYDSRKDSLTIEI